MTLPHPPSHESARAHGRAGVSRQTAENSLSSRTLAAAFATRLLAGRVLRPVGSLTDTVEHVAATQDLSTRIDARGQDEIGRLARSSTAMLSALDGSIQQQRRLVADASHELRTPLTSLTTNLELLAEPGGLADPQAAQLLAAARGQSGELKALINDLVTVADEGPGIPPADLPHIFDRFYRSTSARSKPGSGLGLSIVRQIADTHGGQVGAYPRDHGPGVEFRFGIPVSR